MSTIAWVLGVGTILGIVYFKIVSWLDNRDALKRISEQKKKELQVIVDQVKLLKEVDIKKEKTYEEAKADYNRKYHPTDDSGSNGQ